MRKISALSLFLLAIPFLSLAHGGVNDSELIIRISKNGFEPKELTVVQGDEVLFINNDNNAHWPASNLHPTHALYPEFDPLKGIAPGESWKMKFEKAGVWHMHDHLYPHLTGTITVLSDPGQSSSTPTITETQAQGLWSRIKTFFQRFFSKRASVTEFKTLDERGKYAWLEKVAESEGPKAAWNYVLEAYKTPEGVVGQPHDMAHLVGQLLYKKYGLKGLSTCTPDFAFGCYHGLMEVAFEEDVGNEPVYKEKLLVAQEACGEVAPPTSPSNWSCIHGMGHGIATYRDHNLSQALKDCDSLVGNVQTYCHDGVFMEFSISAPENFYKKADPLYPCDAVSDIYQSACARSQTQVMRLRLGLGTKEISDTCRKSNNDKIIYHCIDSLGYYSAQMAEGNPEKIISNCAEITDERLSAQCLAAAAGELVFQNVLDWQSKTSMVCNSLAGEYKENCQARVTQVKKSYSRE